MIACFPDLYPDEILYSAWARYSDRVQYRIKYAVFQELFGKSQSAAIVDLPCHLGYFVEHLPPENSYTTDWLIDRHTLLPFYSPFLSQDRYKRIHEQMISGNGATIHLWAGIAATSVPSPVSLRYCSRCLEYDRKRFGEGYWHRLHQVPGVEVCPEHMIFLENSTIYLRNAATKHEFVSIDRAISTDIPLVRDATSYQKLIDIAMDVRYLLDHPNIHVEPDLLTEQYKYFLAQQGFLTNGGKVRTTALIKAFINHYPSEFLNLLHCELRPSNGRDITTWLSRFMWRAESMHHPLHHILFMHFLGTKVCEFFMQPFKPYSHFGSGPWPCLNPTCEFFQQFCINTYRLSENFVKRQIVGIFSCSCGYVYSRRGPDRTYEDQFRVDGIISRGNTWENKLYELWCDQNLSISEIARRLNIDWSTVNRHAHNLQFPTPRASVWSASGFHKRKATVMKDNVYYREQWLELMREFPEDSISALRDKASTVYTKLRKYDYEWLNTHKPPKRPFRSTNTTHILQSLKNPNPPEEELIDANIAEHIRLTAHRIIDCTAPSRRVSLTGLLKEIPILARLRRYPERAPLTMQALKEVLETREAFALRRLQKAVQEYKQQKILPSRSQLISKAHLWRQIDESFIQQAIDEALVALS